MASLGLRENYGPGISDLWTWNIGFEEYINITKDDVQDIAHVMKYNNLTTMTINMNGINNFFYIQFRILNQNNVNDISDEEYYYPCDNLYWYENFTHPSFSKNMLINTNRVQDEIQKILMRKSMAQTTYSRA